MYSALNHDRSEIRPEEKRTQKILFWENVSIIFKATGMITWFIICVLTILELKRYFNLDLIPGYDSVLDDAYGAVRGTLSERMGKR